MKTEDSPLHIGWCTLGGWLFLVRLSEPESQPDGSKRRQLSATNAEEQALKFNLEQARAVLPYVRELRPGARIVIGEETG